MYHVTLVTQYCYRRGHENSEATEAPGAPLHRRGEKRPSQEESPTDLAQLRKHLNVLRRLRRVVEVLA